MILAALLNLPFGSARLYHNDGRDGLRLERRGKGGGSGSEESLACQWIALEFRQARLVQDSAGERLRLKRVLSNTHAGPGQSTFGPSHQRKADILLCCERGEEEEEKEHGYATRSRPVTLLYGQYHGAAFHALGMSQKNKRMRIPRMSHSPTCPLLSEFDGEETLPERDDLDELKKRYARVLTAVDPVRVRVEYFVMTTCDLLHQRADARAFGVTLPADREEEAERKVPGVDGLRRRMTELAGREAWVGGKLPVCLPVSELLERIQRGHDPDLGGFALIRNGREEADDLPHPQMQGFCHQRAPAGSVGNFTRWQSKRLGQLRGNTDGAEAELLEKERAPQTFAATSFHAGGELVSLDYLAWLCGERKLTGFTVQHLVVFEERNFLSGFIDDLLQRRWDLRHAGPGEELMRSLLKLCANGKKEKLANGQNKKPQKKKSVLQHFTDTSPWIAEATLAPPSARKSRSPGSPGRGGTRSSRSRCWERSCRRPGSRRKSGRLPSSRRGSTRPSSCSLSPSIDRARPSGTPSRCPRPSSPSPESSSWDRCSRCCAAWTGGGSKPPTSTRTPSTG